MENTEIFLDFLITSYDKILYWGETNEGNMLNMVKLVIQLLQRNSNLLVVNLDAKVLTLFRKYSEAAVFWS